MGSDITSNDMTADDMAADMAAGMTDHDLREAMHELHVHQAELEAQNDELRQMQTALDLHRARYFELYDLAPVAYLTLDETGKIFEANLAAGSLLGVNRSSLIGRPLAAWISSDHIVEYELERRALIDSGGSQSPQFKVVVADGRQIWAQVDATSGLDVAGAFIARIVLRDISQSKSIEFEHECERAVMAALAAAGSLADVLTRALQAVEAAVTQTAGSVLVLDSTGRHLLHGAAPSLPVAVSLALDCIAVGSARCPFDTVAVGDAVVSVADIDSDLRFASVRSVAMNHGLRYCWSIPLVGGHDAVVGVLALFLREPREMWAWERASIMRTATLIGLEIERRQAQVALSDSEFRWQFAVEGAGDGMYDWDLVTDTVFYSERARALYGFEGPPAIITATDWNERVHPDDWVHHEALLHDHFNGVEPVYLKELRIRGHDGGWIWIRDRGMVVSRDRAGEPLRMIGTIADITEERRVAKHAAELDARLAAVMRLDSIGRLAGGVAHDFNNMLGVILGHAEFAMDHIDPSHPVYADLFKIHKAGERSANLTRQLLAFAAQQTVVPKVLDPGDTVSGLATMLRSMIGEDINLALQTQPDQWPINIDPSQFDQILTNLCVNARDAINDIGRIDIEVRNSVVNAEYCIDHTDATPGEYVRITVCDSGTGMDDHTLANIYEPFFTTKEFGVGTGLGLSTVFGAVTQNHGFIEVSSTVGVGTTFEVYLPRYRTEVAVEVDIAEQVPVPVPVSAGRETILLVEDEPTMLELFTEVLQRTGYQVLAADSPNEAIRLARLHAGEIRLLVTDVIMPEMNGQDLAAAVSTIKPSIGHLFMSGYPADVITSRGVLPEGVHFIQKPFSIADFTTKVHAILHVAPAG